jgi:hypothetical protein
VSLDVRELTPRGTGAIAVVRVQGSGALDRVQSLARARLSIGVPRLARLSITGEDVDEALVCVLDASCVEVHVHGSPVLVRAVIAALSTGVPVPDIPRATHAERARRLLATAHSDSAARILLDQAEGAFEREIERLRAASDPRPALDRLAERSRVVRFAIEPALVVLAGPVNAGKSTLFNALAGERKAIVSDEAGTTRDLVRERALLGAYPIELVDTAGEREAPRGGIERDAQRGDVERAGQDRARALRDRADLCLWLAPAASPAAVAGDARVPEPEGALVLTTCADRVLDPPAGAISALRAPHAARETVTRLFRARFSLPEEPWEAELGAAIDPESRSALDFVRAARSELELRQRLDAFGRT